MIELLDIPAAHVIGLQINGKIDDKDIELVVQAAQQAMDNTDKKLGVYVELIDWNGITLKALWEDLKFGLPNLRRFAKKAVVTDKTWVARLASCSRLFPFIKVRCFPFDQKDRALQWIQE